MDRRTITKQPEMGYTGEAMTLKEFFKAHPEIVANKFAARCGMSQSTLSQYVSKIRTPSPFQKERIKVAILELAKELLQDADNL